MSASVQKIIQPLFSYFFPQGCLSCHLLLHFEEKGSLCEPCEKGIRFLSSSLCEICGNPFPHSEISSHRCGKCLEEPPPFEWARSICELNSTLANIIYSFKYQGNEATLSWFEEKMKVWVNQNEALFYPQSVDCLVPVPLHPFRLFKRGYNQSLWLARRLQKILNIPLDFKNLLRIHYEKPQVKRSRKERFKQIQGSIGIKKLHFFKGKKVLLVDDVYTTGATVRECAKILKQSGAQVCVFTFARTPLDF